MAGTREQAEPPPSLGEKRMTPYLMGEDELPELMLPPPPMGLDELPELEAPAPPPGPFPGYPPPPGLVVCCSHAASASSVETPGLLGLSAGLPMTISPSSRSVR